MRPAYFEKPLYLRQRLSEVSDSFSDVYSNGFRFPQNHVRKVKFRMIITKMISISIFKVILQVKIKVKGRGIEYLSEIT